MQNKNVILKSYDNLIFGLFYKVAREVNFSITTVNYKEIKKSLNFLSGYFNNLQKTAVLITTSKDTLITVYLRKSITITENKEQ